MRRKNLLGDANTEAGGARDGSCSEPVLAGAGIEKPEGGTRELASAEDVLDGMVGVVFAAGWTCGVTGTDGGDGSNDICCSCCSCCC